MLLGYAEQRPHASERNSTGQSMISKKSPGMPRLPCAQAEDALGVNELPHVPAEPTIPPPAIAVASAVVAIVPYLLDRAAFGGSVLQLLKHARCWRCVCCGYRDTERYAQRSDRQQLTSHDSSIPVSERRPCGGTSAILGGTGSARCSRSVPATAKILRWVPCWAPRVGL